MGAHDKRSRQNKTHAAVSAGSLLGSFKDDNSLSPEEIRKIVHWVEQGMLRGEGEDPLKEAPRPVHGQWSEGKPDMVFSFPEKQQIPPKGVLPYYLIWADKKIEKDMWVKISEIKADQKQAIHHAIAYTVLDKEKGDVDQMFAMMTERSHAIALYLPGKGPSYSYNNKGIFVPAGSSILLEMHYVPTGKPLVDNSKLGLWFFDSEPDGKLRVKLIEDRGFKIPPGTKNFKVKVQEVLEKDIMAYRLAVHMHYRGKSMKFTAYYPDGTSEILLSVPNYKYQWQFPYVFDKFKYFPAGTRIVVDGVFDNSSQNPEDIDFTKEVTYGINDFDEMFKGSIIYSEIE